MTDETVDRTIPDNLLVSYQPIQLSASLAFYQERYDAAVDLFQQALKILLTMQSQIGRAVHKGAVLYNLGLAYLGIRDRDVSQALHNVLLAYVEDTLQMPFDFEDNADRTPAGRFIIDGFAIQLRLLREIKSTSRMIKKSKETWLKSFNPETIFHPILLSFGIDSSNILILCENRDLALGPVPLGFPQPRERRVFIGTNYDTHSHLIPEMRLAVMAKNYVPVIVRDVVIPPNANVHDVSLLLLHTCGWAVFDVTNPAGQFMEIERTHDYRTNVLLVRSDPVSHPPWVSKMVSSLGYTLQAYRDIPALQQAIINFLPL